ncbi:MAG: hemerythrin domain-containing protein, partial [Bacteroidia bacterium]|nr:hemerythrin domain-containing protein [Bacteroidia bacterium]
DHVHILKLIDVMECIVANKGSDINHLESIVEIIRNFADGLHHAKEENLFFPFLATKGFSLQQGPVAVMLHEHVLGRNFVKGISDNIESLKKGEQSALGEIYKNMKGYSELLRNHIGKENNILFRMADNVLSDSDNHQLLYRFNEAEKAHSSSARSNEFIMKIDKLASHYNI